MITSLRSGEIDIGIGLTEGWVAGLGKNEAQKEGDGSGEVIDDGGYRIVGTYVETPLCTLLWSVLCDAERLLLIHISRLGDFHWCKTRHPECRGFERK